MIDVENIIDLQRRIALFDDELAYKELFFAFHPALKRFAFSFLHNRESAEEVVSDVFVKIWQRRKTLSSIENLRVYLYVSAKHTALNYLSREKREANVRAAEPDLDMPATAQNPEQLMMTAEMLRQVRLAIQALPPRCKMVFKLVKDDGLPYKEVADILNISVKTIDSQLAIALKKISASVSARLTSSTRW